MQTDPNRVSQKNNTCAKIGRNEAIVLAQESIDSALILNPEMPAAEMAALLVKQSDPEIAAVLADVLVTQFYVRGILGVRRKRLAADRLQLRLPGFEHLPLKIPVGGGKRIRLLNANYTAVRAYYRMLLAKHRERKRNDPQIREAKALLERMRRHTRTERRITVRQVLALEELD